MLEKTKRQKVENELKKSQDDRQKFLVQSQNQQTELKKMKDHIASLEAKLLRLERDAQRQKGDISAKDFVLKRRIRRLRWPSLSVTDFSRFNALLNRCFLH